MNSQNRAFFINLLLLANVGISSSIMPELVRRNNSNDNNRSMMAPHNVAKLLQIYSNKPSLQLAMKPRGGEQGTCADSSKFILLKTGLTVIAQSGALLAAIYIGASPKLTTKSSVTLQGLPLSLWVALISVIFGSSFYGSLVEGGFSQATRQVLNPNVLQGDPNWYNALKRPWWEPPGWVFPIMWVIVSKPTQLLAVSRLISSQNDGSSILMLPRLELLVYCTYLALGDAWNKVFFGMQSPGRGVIVITTFLFFLLTSTFLFYSVDQLAGKFMVPTCAWVCGATALNWSIYLNNKK